MPFKNLALLPDGRGTCAESVSLRPSLKISRQVEDRVRPYPDPCHLVVGKLCHTYKSYKS